MMKCSLIVIGDLPGWKKYEKAVSLWWATYPNRKNVKCGLIVMGDLPKMEKNMKWGLIVMGDLPRWKKYDEVRSHCHGRLTRMEKKM